MGDPRMGKYSTLINSVRNLAQVSGLSTLRVMVSFLVCGLFHGASVDNFFSLEMYKYTNKERRKVLTFQRGKKISDKLNQGATTQDEEILVNKSLFNKNFNEFVHQDWLYLPDASFRRNRKISFEKYTFSCEALCKFKRCGNPVLRVKIYHSQEAEIRL